MEIATRKTSTGRSCDMDPELWGNLQNHIDLKSIYGKLPFQEFFQFRLVCKEWNHLASDPQFLEESFKDPNPNIQFVVTAGSISNHQDFEKLHGLLSYDISCSQWSWTRLPSLDDRTGICAVDGLIYSSTYDYVTQEVFDIHTRVCHSLPLAEDITVGAEYGEPFVGMTVDKSVRPYTFQIIVGNYEMSTHIYDSKSNTWMVMPSQMDVGEGPSNANCAYCNDILYIRCFNYDYMVTYDVKKDSWGDSNFGDGDCGINIPRVGVWEDRLFSITADLHHDHDQHVTVWELPDHSKDEWVEYTRVPKDLLSWLAYSDDPSRDTVIHACYCNNYVLVYTWLDKEGLAERFVLFNLLTKAWERVSLPFELRCKAKVKTSGEDSDVE